MNAKLFNIITRWGRNMGISTVPTKEYIIQDVIPFIEFNFKSLKEEDVEMAFNLFSAEKISIPKEKHHFGNLSLPFIGSILTSYTNWKRQKAGEMKLIIGFKEPEQKILPVSKEAHFNEMVSGLTKAYKIFCENGHYLDWGNIYYDWLISIEKCVCTHQDMDDLDKRAFEKVIQDLKENKKNNKNDFAIKNINIDIQRFLNGPTSSDKAQIEREKKQICLNDLFKRLKEFDMTILEWMTEF